MRGPNSGLQVELIESFQTRENSSWTGKDPFMTGEGSSQAWAGRARQCQTEPSRDGQGRTGLGWAAPHRSGHGRKVPGSTGDSWTGLAGLWRVGQCWTGLGKIMVSITGQGQEGQCWDRQDRVEPGWMDHGRIGRVGQDRAVSCKAGHGQTVSGMTAPGRVEQSSTRQNQARLGRTRQIIKSSVSAGQGWERPDCNTPDEQFEGQSRGADMCFLLPERWFISRMALRPPGGAPGYGGSALSPGLSYGGHRPAYNVSTCQCFTEMSHYACIVFDVLLLK